MGVSMYTYNRSLFCNSLVFLNILEIDECARQLDDCDPNAQCGNTPGSFTCSCVTGYMGSGTLCTGNSPPLYTTISSLNELH